MKKLRLSIKKVFVVMLVTSLIMSICVSESFAEEIGGNFEDLENKETYIIRLHDGEYVLVKDMDEDEKTFTFSTKYFSTYAVAFVSATSDKKESKNVIEKKHTVAWTIGIISMLILVGIIAYCVMKKKKRYFR